MLAKAYKFLAFIASLLLYLTVAGQQYSSEGKEFYVSFVPSLLGSPGCEITVSSRTNTTVTIENSAKGFTTTLNLTANTPATATIPVTACIPSKNDFVDKFALHITSNDPISVYAMNFGSAIADGALAYPITAYGADYYVASYEGITASANSSFTIVATEDSTVVEITPTVNTMANHNAGTPYTVNLNKGETYMEFGESTKDLTGTYIREINKKKIAVYSGTKCVNIPAGCSACDVLMEQVIPIDKLGKNYLLANLSADTIVPAYTYRVISTKDNNDISVNGTVVTTLSKGQVYHQANTSAPICLTSLFPIMVIQYTQGITCVKVGDPAMVVIPPVEQFIDRVNYATPNYTGFKNHYVYILVETGSIGTLDINGVAVATNKFKPFPSCNTYSYANIELTPGNHLVNCNNGFLMIAYGYGHAISYAYIGGTNFRKLNFDIGLQGVTCGSLDINALTLGDTSEVLHNYWDFGDGTTDSGLAVSKTYQSHGSYTIQNVIIAGKDKPITDTLYKVITTKPLPVAGFDINQVNQCVKENTYSFTDSSKYVGTKLQNIWQLGDSVNVYNSDKISKVFATDSTYTIKLISISKDLCSDTVTQQITVKPSVKADFTIKDSLCLKGNTFFTTQLSSIKSPQTISKYEWDFNDNTSASIAQPQKTYTDTGLYTVRLIAFADNGCHDTTVKLIRVLPSPKATYTTTNVCDRDTAVFTSTATGNGSDTLLYTWSFGDGGINTNSIHPKKRYLDSGNFISELLIRNEFGCSDSTTLLITVYPKPKAAFSWVGKCINRPIDFTDNSTRFGTPIKENIWRLDNGAAISNTSNISTTYNSIGSKTITLTTFDINGCVDSSTRLLYINPSPIVDFEFDKRDQCFKDNVFLAKNTSTVPQGKISKYSWYLNNTYRGDSTILHFSQPSWGSFPLKLKAETDSMCNDSIEKQLTVHPQNTLDIQVNAAIQCEQNNLFTFTNNSWLPLGTATYKWDISTGTSFIGDNLPPQKFGLAGGYFVKVFSETDKGCKDTTRLLLKVLFNPSVDFTVKDVCENDSAFFKNTSTYSGGNSAQWFWDFGDGNTATKKEPKHQFPAAGYYTVTQIGISSEGCSDTIVRDSAIRIFPAPEAYFKVESENNINNVINVVFSNLTKNATRYYWTFGNGEFSPVKEAATMYYDTGKYKVSLFAVNDDNCTDFYDSMLYLAPTIDINVPNAFTPNKDPLNPVFKIEGSYYYKDFELLIFNRWGTQVFKSNDASIGWNGTYLGELAPEGVYTYAIHIIGIDSKIYAYKGALHLIR